LINYGVSEDGSPGSWGAPAVPDAAWPKARTAVIADAAGAGFTTVQTIVDKPGDHALAIQGSYGAILNVGVGKRTTLDIRSGCHLLPGATKPTPTPAG
jgi:hypothetical protein